MFRFEDWTTPEYYETAEKNFRNGETNRKKAEILVERREKLRKLLKNENEQYEQELKGIF